jgi:hypothetical protein
MTNPSFYETRTSPSVFSGVPLDIETIPQKRLNIDNKERNNLFAWNGQFSPQLVEQLLATYAKPLSFVLDPFLGSGTVLHEAGRLGFSGFGAEINPAALKMADTYSLINVSSAKRRKILDHVEGLIGRLTPDAEPLFASRLERTDRPVHESLIHEAAIAPDPLVRKLFEALVVMLNIGGREVDQKKVSTTWDKLRQIVISLPFSDAPLEAANCDARALPLPPGHVDIVVTSPPYINVFNYHQHYRKSVEAMGWDLLKVAKSEIGSNRRNRGNRFLTVAQYCLDMSAVFREIRRVCKPDARVIFVVGRESNVRKTVFRNGEIVAEIAVRFAGFEPCPRQERVFQNRFGEMIFEDILHFTVGPALKSPADQPSDLAREILEAALNRVPAESEADLRSAIERVADVSPSPLYQSPETQSFASSNRP